MVLSKLTKLVAGAAVLLALGGGAGAQDAQDATGGAPGPAHGGAGRGRGRPQWTCGTEAFSPCGDDAGLVCVGSDGAVEKAMRPGRDAAGGEAADSGVITFELPTCDDSFQLKCMSREANDFFDVLAAKCPDGSQPTAEKPQKSGGKGNGCHSSKCRKQKGSSQQGGGEGGQPQKSQQQPGMSPQEQSSSQRGPEAQQGPGAQPQEGGDRAGDQGGPQEGGRPGGEDGRSEPSTAMIVGIASGVFAVGMIAGVAATKCCCRKKTRLVESNALLEGAPIRAGHYTISSVNSIVPIPNKQVPEKLRGEDMA